VHVDHSRSFITTEVNPYYDSFIRWQFTLLKERGYIKYGKRASIYSPKDKQMCADHDRSEGEGVGPDEYTLIKIQITEFNARLEQQLKGRKVFLVAATLRPETMYGQTSCFVLPAGDYCAVEMKNDEVFICSERSALNMAYQGLTKEDEKVSILDSFKGEELIGLQLSAPNAIHQRVYVLPMMTISMKKGTGVVTCVPSDSPDDWMATCDLRNKKALRDKYNITEEMVSL
jgi:leucyl-tRNA synthetase